MKLVKPRKRCCKSRPRCKRCPVVCKRLEMQGLAEREVRRRWVLGLQRREPADRLGGRHPLARGEHLAHGQRDGELGAAEGPHRQGAAASRSGSATKPPARGAGGIANTALAVWTA